MKITNTHLNGLQIIEPLVFEDDRGYFCETFNYKNFSESIGVDRFVQDNESKSVRGVLRGLHFQKPPFAQSKLVRCIQGEILDVAVDIRKHSPTYGEYFKILLSSENKKQLFIPKGFAHGYSVLSDTAIFAYKVDKYYAPNYEDGIMWNDEDLNIDWQLMISEIKLSEKDKNQKLFKEFTTPFQ